jgi:hypothetical protein
MEVTAIENEKIGQLVDGWFTHPEHELEATFGFKGSVDLDTFMNVAQRLRARGYEALPQEDKLNIILPEHLRFSIMGTGTIQSYCRDNTLANKGFIAMIKDRIGVESTLDLTEYDVRIKTRREKNLDHSDPAVRKPLESWGQQRKAFRLIQRWTFIGDGVQFDLSVVKSSRKDKTNNNEYDWRRSFEESRVVDAAPTYEIEVELLRDKIATPAEAKAKLIKGVGEVLRGIQKNALLIRNSQRLKVLEGYKELAATDRFRGVYPVTLEKKNMSLEIEEGVPNIRQGYNVTDKADGQGVIGYCDSRGELFMLDSGLNVYKTGLQVGACADSMVAGEWIMKDKEDNGVSHLLLFDIFYAPAKQAVDSLPFIAQDVAVGAGNAESVSDADGRYRRLKRWIDTWNAGDGPKKLGYAGTAAMIGSILRVSVKTFEIAAAGDNSIFALANKMLDAPRFYHTDGLILTSNTAPLPGPSDTFFEQFKWKPPAENTVDFLVRYEKNAEYVSVDKITPSFDPETREPIRYKTVKLYVRGAKGGAFANPRGAILVEDFGSPNAAPAAKGPSDRQPVLFNPVEFPDTMAATAYVRVDGSDELAYTEKEEPLQDRSIVEMRYDPSRDPGWRWIPMRTRHDKTERLRRGIVSRTMNAAGTAENIWNSIHDPVTTSMIRTGAEQPLKEEIDDILKSREGMEQVGKVYYEGAAKRTAVGTVRDSKEPQPNLIEVKGLRDFHNSWIKQGILFKTALAGGQKKLIDVGSGKGGDLNKWEKNGARFVLGIDYNGNNITDPADGAYKRYMQLIEKKGREKVPTVVFVIGDGAKDWTSGEAGVTPEEKNILRSVFSKIEPDGPVPRFVERYAAGSLQGGADVISAMFTLHYFFGNEATVNGMINNIAKTLKVGGYFIGACFDGQAVVKALRQTETGGRKLGKVGDDVVWSIRKNYEGNELPASEEGLGMAIDVNFVSIGSEEQREFLVSFPYLVRKLAEIGVEPLTPEEQRGLRLRHTTAMFEESFKMSEKSKAGFIMPDAVKEYSFLNRWFIFKRKAEAGIVKAAATAATAIPSADEEEMVVLDINDTGAPATAVAPQVAQGALSRTVRANAAAVGAVASEVPIPEEVVAAERTVASLAAPVPAPLPAAPARTIPVSVPEGVRPRKRYAAAQVVKFSFDATAREAQKLGIVDDKAAAQWLAPSAPFDIPDPDDATIMYPSLDHYIAGRKIMKASNRPDLARELMSSTGTIHRKFHSDRLAITGAGKRKMPESRDKELLFLEANMVKVESTPEGLSKYGATFSLETWAGVKDEVLRDGLRYRFDHDARFRAILERAKSESKYLLYTGATGSEYGGLLMTDGTIAGPNKMGEYMMQIAGYEV